MRTHVRAAIYMTLDKEERFDLDLRTGPANIWQVSVSLMTDDPDTATVRGTMIKRDGSHGALNREGRILIEHLPDHVRAALCLEVQNKAREWFNNDWTATFALSQSQA
jgi:hypothetical protein